MDDYEIIKSAGKMLQEYMDSTSDDDFEVNPPQMEKFEKVKAFFEKMVAEDQYAEIKEIDLIPRMMVGSIVADFTSFDVADDELDEFKEILQYVSVFGVNVQLAKKDDPQSFEKVRVEVNVPDVFIPKAQ